MALSQSRGKPSETVATASLNARAEVNGMSPAVAKALDDAGYDVGRFIGKGSFSRVFMGIRRRDGKAVALKVIFADSRERRVANEVDQLVLAGGSHNIVKLLQYHRCGLTSILVLPYVRHDNFRDQLPHMSMEDIGAYMKALLTALARLEQLNIVHRDVKPRNFLYDAEARTGVLVDFGLAHREAVPSHLKPHNPPLVNRVLHSPGMEDPASSVTSPVTSPLPESMGLGSGCGDTTAMPMPGDAPTAAAAAAIRRAKVRGVDAVPVQPPRAIVAHALRAHAATTTAATTTAAAATAATAAAASGPRQSVASAALADAARGGGRATPLESALATAQVPKHRGGLVRPRRQALPRTTARSGRIARLRGHAPARPVVMPPSRLGGKVAKAMGVASTVPRTSAVAPRPTKLAPRTRLPPAPRPGGGAAAAAVVASRPVLPRRRPLPRRASSRRSKRTAPGAAPKRIQRSSSSRKTKRQQRALRGGTPGFRPPEVLLASAYQTTALDVWAAGVILASLLTRRYPFFKLRGDNGDGFMAAQAIGAMGTRHVQIGMASIHKMMMQESAHLPGGLPLLLNAEEARLRKRGASSHDIGMFLAASDLLYQLMDANPSTRIRASAALQHPFITGGVYCSCATCTDAGACAVPGTSPLAPTTSITPISTVPASPIAHVAGDGVDLVASAGVRGRSKATPNGKRECQPRMCEGDASITQGPSKRRRVLNGSGSVARRASRRGASAAAKHLFSTDMVAGEDAVPVGDTTTVVRATAAVVTPTVAKKAQHRPQLVGEKLAQAPSPQAVCTATVGAPQHEGASTAPMLTGSVMEPASDGVSDGDALTSEDMCDADSAQQSGGDDDQCSEDGPSSDDSDGSGCVSDSDADHDTDVAMSTSDDDASAHLHVVPDSYAATQSPNRSDAGNVGPATRRTRRRSRRGSLQQQA